MESSLLINAQVIITKSILWRLTFSEHISKRLIV